MASLLEIVAACEWTRQDDDNVTIVKGVNVRSCSVSAPEIVFTLAAEIGVNVSAIAVTMSSQLGVTNTFFAEVQAGIGPGSPAKVIVTPTVGGGTPEGSFIVVAASPMNVPSA